MNNYEKIKNMSIEEMAHSIDIGYFDQKPCESVSAKKCKTYQQNSKCYQCTLDYLQQEAE